MGLKPTKTNNLDSPSSRPSPNMEASPGITHDVIPSGLTNVNITHDVIPSGLPKVNIAHDVTSAAIKYAWENKTGA